LLVRIILVVVELNRIRGERDVDTTQLPVALFEHSSGRVALPTPIVDAVSIARHALGGAQVLLVDRDHVGDGLKRYLVFVIECRLRVVTGMHLEGYLIRRGAPALEGVTNRAHLTAVGGL